VAQRVRAEEVLIYRGAEADIILKRWHGREVIIKRRIPKRYRVAQLDFKLRQARTIHESFFLHRAKLAGVEAPALYMVDLADTAIIMQYVKGTKVRQLLPSISAEEGEKLCYRIGSMIGRLHVAGIMHGDLTTSNMIADSHGHVFFIDFGLSDNIRSVEEEGVDLHLMERALQSTHYRSARENFEAIVAGYKDEVGSEKAKKVLERVREIERRARYVVRSEKA
jgi:TP53 regulating kinase-like protein